MARWLQAGRQTGRRELSWAPPLLAACLLNAHSLPRRSAATGPGEEGRKEERRAKQICFPFFCSPLLFEFVFRLWEKRGRGREGAHAGSSLAPGCPSGGWATTSLLLSFFPSFRDPEHFPPPPAPAPAPLQLEEDLLPPPNEKERRRMALAVSCVALLITVVAALLVGATLGLSHYMDAMVPGE